MERHNNNKHTKHLIGCERHEATFGVLVNVCARIADINFGFSFIRNYELGTSAARVKETERPLFMWSFYTRRVIMRKSCHRITYMTPLHVCFTTGVVFLPFYYADMESEMSLFAGRTLLWLPLSFVQLVAIVVFCPF